MFPILASCGKAYCEWGTWEGGGDNTKDQNFPLPNKKQKHPWHFLSLYNPNTPHWLSESLQSVCH